MKCIEDVESFVAEDAISSRFRFRSIDSYPDLRRFKCQSMELSPNIGSGLHMFVKSALVVEA